MEMGSSELPFRDDKTINHSNTRLLIKLNTNFFHSTLVIHSTDDHNYCVVPLPEFFILL